MPTGSIVPRLTISRSSACPFSINFTWLALYIEVNFYKTSVYIVFATDRKDICLETAIRLYSGVACCRPNGGSSKPLLGLRVKSQHFVALVVWLETIHFPTAHTETIAEGITLEDALIEARLFGMRHAAVMTF